MLSEEEQDAEPQKSVQETRQIDDEDAELIFVGVEHVNDDSEPIFIGVTSNSKPAMSNILNRVTPGSHLRRKRNRRRRNIACRLQPVSHVDLTSETVTILPDSPSELRSTDSPIIIESLSESDYEDNSPEVVPSSSSKLCPSLCSFTNSLPYPARAALSVGDIKESPPGSKQCSAFEVNGMNPQIPKLNVGFLGGGSSASVSSGSVHAVDSRQNTPSDEIHVSLNHVQKGVPFPKDIVHFSSANMNPDRENGLARADFSSLGNQNKTCDSKKGNPTLLLSDFYYGQHEGNEQPEQKTNTTFKCLSCLKALKNVKFMNHTKHHLELEKQTGDSWESHTTCQHCFRRFPSPLQLERHVDFVHVTQEPSVLCRICELSFETDQVLLEHMKDNHKPGEMPYVCQICHYRSSIFADVETHFRKCHANTKNLLCPFCLKIFKTGTPYMCHYRKHWEANIHQCSKCRLQFLTFKEKMEHETQRHQMFKKPKQLEGMPPDTKVVIQVSVDPVQSGPVKVASITLSTADSEPFPPKPLSLLLY